MFPDDEVGDHLGRYEVVRKLATGGMAEIYLARMRGAAGFEKLCVLKRILPSVADDHRLVAMFLDEARLSATLRHPNIADVFDLGTDNGSYFFAMEYIHGQDARELRLQAHTIGRPIPLEIALAVIHGVAAALAYAHDKVGPEGPLELVHRDVSPGNILISYDGAVKLVDFGIARAASRSAVTKSGTLKGKIPYMSPEQCQGQALDRRSDLFSLGIVLYELTVGCRPFRGNSEFAIMERIVNRPPRAPGIVLQGFPYELEMIVMKLLARDRRDRYQTAQELLVDLDRFTTKHDLAITPTVLAKYMRSLFPGQIAAWEAASRHGRSLAQHLADTVQVPAVRPLLDSPAYGVVVARDDDDLEAEAEATVDQRSPMRAEELATVERKLGIVDDLLSYERVSRVPSRDFSMDDPTHQAKPADMLFAGGEATTADLVRAFDPIEEYRLEIEAEVAAHAVRGEPAAAQARRRFEGLLARAVASHDTNEPEKAMVAVDLALEDPDEALEPSVIARHDKTITSIFETFLGDRTRLPALARPFEDLATIPLGPQAAFLLSRIDGLASLDDLLDVSGMPRRDACRHLCQLYLLGILQ